MVETSTETRTQYTPPLATPPQRAAQVAGVLLKVVIAVVVIVALAILGYLFGSLVGRKAATASPTPVSQGTSTTTTTTSSATANPVSSGPLEAQTATPKTVKAGIQTSAFSPYSIGLGSGWTETHTTDANAKTDKLVVTKDNYTLTISQVSGGAGVCLYPDDPPQDSAQSFTKFSGIPGLKLQYRRGTNDGTNFTICEKRDKGFIFPTEFGSITYTTPSSPDTQTLNDMDAMVASLSK